MWRDLDGPASLVWWNSDSNTINFITNGKRPLWFSYTEDMNALFWTSEDWMFDIVGDFSRIKFEKVWQPNPDFLFTVKLEANEISYTTKKLEAFTWPDYLQRHPIPKRIVPPVHKNQLKIPFMQKFIKSPDPKVINIIEAKKDPKHLLQIQRRMEKKRKKQKAQILQGARHTLDGTTMSDTLFHAKYIKCLNCEEDLAFNDPDIQFLDYERAFCGTCTLSLDSQET